MSPIIPQRKDSMTAIPIEVAPTEYVVLRRIRAEFNQKNSSPTNLREQWEKVATVSARSAEGANRKAASKSPPLDANPSGTPVLVAIPARSWKPVTVTAEVQTKLKLESA